MTTPLATVVVVNWNGVRLLPQTLDTLMAQDLPRDLWDAYVVDNASTDGSADLVRERYPDVKLVVNERNLGFSAGNNVVLRELRAPYAVLLNSDARPRPDWLRRLVETMEEPGNERVAAVTSKMVFQPTFVAVEVELPGYQPPHDGRELGIAVSAVEVREGSGAWEDVTGEVLWESFTYPVEPGSDGPFRWTRPSGGMLVPVPESSDGPLNLRIRARAPMAGRAVLRVDGHDHAFELRANAVNELVVALSDVKPVDVVNNAGGILVGEGYGADRGYQEVDTAQYDERTDVFSFCGGAVILRMSALESLGLLDERFFLYYEDSDLSWRMHAAGWKVLYEPTAVVRHVHSASSGEWSPTFTFNVERNRLLMLVKNASPRLAVRATWRYFGFVLLDIARAARLAFRTRRRPAVTHHVLRLRILASFLKALPVMVADRRARRATWVVPPREVERRWLQRTR